MPTILFVEDDHGTSEVVRLMLHPLGVKVVNQDYLDDVIGIVEEIHPDLILLDLRLPSPSVDGLTAARILKDDPHTRHIPIIILTAMGSTHEEQEAYQIGCEAFLRKPISPIDLRDYLTPYLA